MKKTLDLRIIRIDQGCIFDMLDELIKESFNCN